MEPSLYAAFGLGLILGVKHALDADHLVAVSTIVSEHKDLKWASLIGAFWGLGHTATLFAVGLLVIGLRVTISPRFALGLEFLVAVMLVFLGINILWRSFGVEKIHLHTHTHNPETHTHFHVHGAPEQEHSHTHPFKSMRKPFFVGMVHGLAGSAALMLLVLTAIPSPLAGLAYILIFGFGSVGGMLVLSSLIGLPFVLTAQRFSHLNRWIRVTAALASVAFGLYLGWEIGFDQGLF
ncbi:MAG: sulfite exporter TauE/SafE family protein [Deltaproteobacteria bacterium]|jgi:sulfite exporter TauE/SafE|nr:sulfite exporter TauE/SafE family protein [Deltaproteobacteria bacterium]MBI2181387.1 sulfite exporter TauE/SafE family protein [Deltaproteobacteria bacterium]MBI2231273.1 sulfite exporter TauE/SafE family protein [Deltaproteobacteria bacterium]MBI2366410.1 sulfite exporter TauE/SafE family protein [Deltaproteobacteria bacterium]MBI2530949.1 sulfite exporter TauE/SafE family protein [Deltaproteobacteria bacterium]